MTTEEAKKYFGENRYRPDLGFLMDEHQRKPAHCKVGEAYWWASNPHFSDPITDRMKWGMHFDQEFLVLNPKLDDMHT